MTPDVSLALLVMGALAAAAPLATRVMGRNAGYPLAAGYLVAAVPLGLRASEVVAGERLVERLAWVPSLGVELTIMLDALSLLFALLILIIGALVMAYSAHYLHVEGPHGRFYGMLTLFAVSMLGLVLAGDIVLLFVFWELTSMTSFFLIGGGGAERESKAATRAFLVTGLGGLALFAGLLLLGVAAGDTDLRVILERGAALRDHPVAPAAMILVLLGAFTKSAQVPFHFWLPGAMVAPTPVSTYLHAATMVKAGIYLLARLSPVFGGSVPWTYTIVLVGLVTAVAGAFLALKQHDLKALLAYSTVSQLGLIVALVGVGTFPALAAAAIHTLAHAAYKATLFMVVGIIDREAGSRDIRRLSGLRKVMPITATITGLAAMSMAGLPPLLGFVSKEEAFGAFLAAPGAAWLGPLAVTLAVGASIATFAYGARILDGAFGGPVTQRLFEPARRFYLPAAVTALAGVGLGIGVSALDPLIGRVASDALGGVGKVDLALWHGFVPALGLSALTIAAGTAAFVLRRGVDRTLARLRTPLPGVTAFDRASTGLVSLGRASARPFSSSSPARHLVWVLGVVVTAGVAAWFVGVELPVTPPPASQATDWVVAGLLAAAVVGAARTHTRIAAVALVGIAGFLVAVLYVLFGAPDLALTQLLVETLTVVLVVLVFRRLPRTFRTVAPIRRIAAVAVALTAGLAATGATYAMTGRRGISEAGGYFLRAAPEETGGENVVNTILVDFRALDTLGEITVLAVAALGVIALVRLAGRDGDARAERGGAEARLPGEPSGEEPSR